jgi:hypothetical protein
MMDFREALLIFGGNQGVYSVQKVSPTVHHSIITVEVRKWSVWLLPLLLLAYVSYGHWLTKNDHNKRTLLHAWLGCLPAQQLLPWSCSLQPFCSGCFWYKICNLLLFAVGGRQVGVIHSPPLCRKFILEKQLWCTLTANMNTPLADITECVIVYSEFWCLFW